MLEKNALSLAEKVRMGFGNRLLESIKNSGSYPSERRPYFIDINKFAADTNVTAPMLRRYLSGTALPTFEAIEHMAKKLNVDAAWLFAGTESHGKK